jgi:Xaa-Pro aminopeptidase
MADEYPSVKLHPDFDRGYDTRFEENMVLCVESLIGEQGGRESIKLETQVVIKANGAERLDSFPWETA